MSNISGEDEVTNYYPQSIQTIPTTKMKTFEEIKCGFVPELVYLKGKETAQDIKRYYSVRS